MGGTGGGGGEGVWKYRNMARRYLMAETGEGVETNKNWGGRRSRIQRKTTSLASPLSAGEKRGD